MSERRVSVAHGATRQGAEQADYAGAVYGSLLAASVIAGTSPRREPPPPGVLIALLLATGVVFWLAHVYARLVGDRQRGAPTDWAEMRRVGRREWPLVQAAFPPAAVAAVCAVIGLSDVVVVWAALLAALAGQVTWAMIASARANATTGVIAVSAAVNLVLGLIIVVLKVLIVHH